MDKKLYKIITEIWKHLKTYLNDMDNMNNVEWWNSEKADAEKILAMVDDEPKYVKDFVFNMLNEVFTLLYAIYKERKYE